VRRVLTSLLVILHLHAASVLQSWHSHASAEADSPIAITTHNCSDNEIRQDISSVDPCPLCPRGILTTENVPATPSFIDLRFWFGVPSADRRTDFSHHYDAC